MVDLQDAEYMDSSALGMLLQLRDHGAKACEVELVNGNQGIREILRIANFDKLFRLPERLSRASPVRVGCI